MFTPALNHIGQMCLEFSYHMYGAGVGILQVYIQTGDVYRSTEARVVFTRSGQQGDQWVNMRLTVETTDEEDRVCVHHAFSRKLSFVIALCLTSYKCMPSQNEEMCPP